MHSTLALATFAIVLTALTVGIPQPTGRKGGVAIPITKRFRSLEGNKTEKRRNKVPLTEFGSETYYGPVSVGTPPQLFEVVFDTAFSNFLLPAATCESCKGHSLWDPSASKTSNRLRKKFNIEFEDGSSAKGIVYSDTVSLSGITASTQIIYAANSYSEQLRIDEFIADGVIGMGFRDDDTPSSRSIPIFQNLVSEGQIIDPVFSFKLSTSGGELYLGGINLALFTGSFTYAPVTRSGYWQVMIDNIQCNGRMILGNLPAHVDTGSNYVYGTSRDVFKLHMLLGGTPVHQEKGFYTFPCNAFPTVSLSIGGTLFPISPSNLNAGPVEDDSSDTCYSGIVGEDDLEDETWILGVVFLQNVYTTFDYGGQQVGFAELAKMSG